MVQGFGLANDWELFKPFVLVFVQGGIQGLKIIDHIATVFRLRDELFNNLK